MLGQINLSLIWYWLGYSPESYWIFVMFKCFFFLGFIWKLRIQHSAEIFYMTEFCWVTCHTYMIFLCFAFLSACRGGCFRKQVLIPQWWFQVQCVVVLAASRTCTLLNDLGEVTALFFLLLWRPSFYTAYRWCCLCNHFVLVLLQAQAHFPKASFVSTGTMPRAVCGCASDEQNVHCT